MNSQDQHNLYPGRTLSDIIRHTAQDIALVACMTGSILGFYGCNNADKTFTNPDGTKVERFYTHRESLDKKVFIYDQGLNSNVLMDKTIKTADYIMPHLFDIAVHDHILKKVGIRKGTKKDKKGKFISTPIYKEIPIHKHTNVNNVPIEKSNLNKLLKEARADSVYILPMVSAFDKEAIEDVLNHPRKYAKIISEKIESLPVQGVSIDFENVRINSEDSYKLTRFMNILRDDLPKPYIISIAVSPRFENSEKNGFPHHGFYNYKSLAHSVDYVNLMCYDFHKGDIGPSPVMPENMFLEVLKYAKANLPEEKIVPILPFYGYVWAKTKYGEYVGKGTLSSKNGNVYNKKSIIKSKYVNGEHYIETKNRIIYSQDAKTFDMRFDILDTMNITNMGGWRSDHGSNMIYNVINGWKDSVK